MDSFRYSIIIPHYNAPDTLIKLLESIPARADIQVIIVDDNSTADISRVRDYIANRPQCECYVNSTGIQSPGVCRNIGMSHARGKWVLFADADDYFTGGFVDIIDRWYDTEHDLILFVPTSIDIHTGELASRHKSFEMRVCEYQKTPNRQNELNVKYRLLGPCSKMIRRRFLETWQICFEPLPLSEDNMFSVRLAQHAASFATEAETIYVITQSKTSLTGTYDVEKFAVNRDTFVRCVLYLRHILSEEDWELLGLSGDWHLRKIIRNDLGRKCLRETIQLFRAANIKLSPQYSGVCRIAWHRMWSRAWGKAVKFMRNPLKYARLFLLKLFPGNGFVSQ